MLPARQLATGWAAPANAGMQRKSLLNFHPLGEKGIRAFPLFAIQRDKQYDPQPIRWPVASVEEKSITTAHGYEITKAVFLEPVILLRVNS